MPFDQGRRIIDPIRDLAHRVEVADHDELWPIATPGN